MLHFTISLTCAQGLLINKFPCHSSSCWQSGQEDFSGHPMAEQTTVAHKTTLLAGSLFMMRFTVAAFSEEHAEYILDGCGADFDSTGRFLGHGGGGGSPHRPATLLVSC